MNRTEFSHLLGAVVVLTIVIGFKDLVIGNLSTLSNSLLFAVILVSVSVSGKKLMANMLDLDVEHRMWTWSQWGWRSNQHFEKPMPSGIIIPFVLTLLSRGVIKSMSVLTYEAKAKTVRASKRFGFYSYTDLTDWHNALIGAGGIIAVLALSAISYFLPNDLVQLSVLGAGYAFWNMIPFSDLDGSQIFFGSRVLYSTLGVITLIFSFYAFFFWLI